MVSKVKQSEAAERLQRDFQKSCQISDAILSLTTPDFDACFSRVLEPVCQDKKDGTKFPTISWDYTSGVRGLNDTGAKVLEDLVFKKFPDFATEIRDLRKEERAKALADKLLTISQNHVDALLLMQDFPPKSKVFFLDAQRALGEWGVVRGVRNLRDRFKSNGRMLILVEENTGVKLPAELTNNVTPLEEALPNEGQLLETIGSTYEAAGLPIPAKNDLMPTVDAVRGLSDYAVESIVARNLKRSGIDNAALWETKRVLIEQTPGLSVWRGGDKFEDIGGVVNIKNFMARILTGNAPPRSIVFIDEIEKCIGTGQDTSGVSQSMLGTLLSYMQDKEASGLIFIGPPGAAKSAVAKAAGNLINIPTIAFDLSGMKSSFVGSSEERLRNALKVVSSVSDDSVLFIATCNSITALPPELRRRFTFGTFFFDLPDAEERAAIWKIYMNKWKIPSQDMPNDVGWTGAEIKQAATLVSRLSKPGNPFTLKEAAQYIVPVAVSAGAAIEGLRKSADKRFISASHPGYYEYKALELGERVAEVAQTKTARSISV